MSRSVQCAPSFHGATDLDLSFPLALTRSIQELPDTQRRIAHRCCPLHGEYRRPEML